MKRILITGAGSYIGTAISERLGRCPELYEVFTIDVTKPSWKEMSFSNYDTVINVAGIAHIKETKENEHIFYEVNRDLAIMTAEKYIADLKESSYTAKGQYIYLSSLSVYGKEEGSISKDTKPEPKTAYGKSKLQAEEELERRFYETALGLCVLRPPMVYGKNCKGNFQKMIKLVKLMPVFPKVENERSMINIGSLCEFIKKLIDDEKTGTFIPQNAEYMNTTHMAENIAEALGKKIHKSAFLGLAVKVGMIFVKPLKKAFGSLVVESGDYERISIDLCDSVKQSV